MSVELTEQNFEQEFTNADKGLVLLLDFNAEWCGPCRVMDKVLGDFEAANEGKVKVLKIDVDQQPTLSAQFQIRSIPTVLSYKDGQQIERKAGGQNNKSIQDMYAKAQAAPGA